MTTERATEESPTKSETAKSSTGGILSTAPAEDVRGRTVAVRQREYALGERGTTSSRLRTGNISTCMAFAGVDEEKGLVFLCHLDGFWCMPALKELANELQSRGDDLAGFRLYSVAGVDPWVWYSMMLLSMPMALRGWWIAAAIFLAVGIMFSTTRMTFHIALKNLRAFKTKPTPLRPSSRYWFLRRTEVIVDANLGGRPEPTWYKKEFGEPHPSKFRMTRSPLSAARVDPNRTVWRASRAIIDTSSGTSRAAESNEH